MDRTTKPVGNALVRTGITADVLTVFGLVMSVVTAIAVGSGHLVWGVILLFPTGLPDLFDGPVAKAAGTASIRGAFFDSVADRVSDAFIFGGVSWYLAAHHHGQMVLLPFAILALTALISYQRAKAELLGLSAGGGLMERAERFILLGVCFIAGAVSSAAFVPALWVFFGLITATALGRFVRVWQEAEGPVRTPSLRPLRAIDPERALARRRDARVDSRWRTWRETRAQRDATGVHFVQPQRADQPLGRWRARRQSVIASRSGRIWRARRAERPRERSGRRPGAGGS
ncbi:MAG TPA: CDP-alcohol phosphatidyltransferase family protein [Acidimicrobiales bacterium]|nr:CDP-alcohol phosphatidyltransferase family protein [Acidimicrobiales bacterium]